MRLLFFLIAVLQYTFLCSQNCEEMLKSAMAAEKRGAYFDAYKKYDAALNRCDDTKTEEIERKKQGLVVQLEQQRERAERAEQLATEALTQVKKEQSKTIEALVQVEQSKIMADSALTRANKLINAFYFFDKKFALAFNYGMFYFIDKNGNPIPKLKKWKTAQQFNWIAYSKVSDGNSTFLLDTLGYKYKLVFDLTEIDTSIRAIDLSNQKLNEIPKEIFKFKNIEILILSSNNIDSLPIEITQLSKLKVLILDNNFIEDLPVEISLLEKIEVLSIASNRIVHFPDEICRLQHLKTLDLSENHIDSLPVSFTKLHSLSELRLTNNKLLSLPDRIDQLTKLSVLKVSSNILGFLPESISQLKELTYIDVSDNNLSDLPVNFSYLENLGYLDLSSNYFIEINKDLGHLSSLEYLNLSDNRLEYLPEELKKLSNLLTLDVSRNSLTILPDTLYYLKHIKNIISFYNKNDLSSIKSVDFHNRKYNWPTDLRIYYSIEKLLQRFVNLSDDTLIIVNFWATYCGPCIREIPYFDSLQQQYANHHVKIILASLDFRHHIEGRLIPFLKEHYINTEVVVLEDQDADYWVSQISSYWDGGLPFSLLLKGGKRYFHISEFRDYNELKQWVGPYITK